VTTLGRSTLLLNSKAPERMKQSVIIIIIIKNVTITVRDTVTLQGLFTELLK